MLMIQSGFEILGREFTKALIETLQMMAISMAVSAVFGLLLGFVLFLTSVRFFSETGLLMPYREPSSM